MKAALLALVLSGCTVAGWVKDGAASAGGHVVEWIACPTDLIDCGHVYMCAAPADNPLGHVELCINDDDHPEDVAGAEDLWGECELTPRHEGLCIWCCGPDCGAGANAFNGAFCP